MAQCMFPFDLNMMLPKILSSPMSVRHRGAERRPLWSPNCSYAAQKMRVGPSGLGYKTRSQTALELLKSRAPVVSVLGKGATKDLIRCEPEKRTKVTAIEVLTTFLTPNSGSAPFGYMRLPISLPSNYLAESLFPTVTHCTGTTAFFENIAPAILSLRWLFVRFCGPHCSGRIIA